MYSNNMKSVKKVITTVAIGMILSPTLNASTQYEATITDVKESLYYLIKNYESTTGAIKDNEENIKGLQAEIDKKFSKADASSNALSKEITLLKGRIKALSNIKNISKADIKRLKEQLKVQDKLLESLKTKNLQKVQTDKKLDKKISDFLEEK